MGKTVAVQWHRRDRYARVVGKVLVGRQDICLQQVRDGLSWWYGAYTHEQDAFDRSDYESAEADARINRRELWTDPRPVPPWDWRRVELRKR